MLQSQLARICETNSIIESINNDSMRPACAAVQMTWLRLQTAGAAQRGKPTQQYDLLLDEDAPNRQHRDSSTHQASKEKQRPAKRPSTLKHSRDEGPRSMTDRHENGGQEHEQSRHKRSRRPFLEDEEVPKGRRHSEEEHKPKGSSLNGHTHREERSGARRHTGDEYRSSHGDRGPRHAGGRRRDYSHDNDDEGRDTRQRFRRDAQHSGRHEHDNRRSKEDRHSSDRHAHVEGARHADTHRSRDTANHYRR